MMSTDSVSPERPRGISVPKLKNPPQSATVSRARVTKGQLLLFASSLCLNLAAAYVLAFQIKFALGDAMARTYSAFAAIYSFHPHLATIGFIWPPLPTFLQIPFVAIGPLTYYGFAGMIISSIFGAGSVLLLDILYRHYGFRWWARVMLALLFVANPYILYYSANGMSEIAFVFFFTLALACFAAWDKHNQWRMIAMMGIAVTGAFYTRYDAIGLALAFFGGIILMMPKRGEDAPDRIEGTLLAFSVLVGYGISVWMFLNWSIMKDPLYFYRSEYSNLAITRSMRSAPEVLALQQSLAATMQYATDMMYRISPLFVGLAVVLTIASVIRRNAGMFVLVLLSLSVPAFQVFMFRQGSTFGFDRFYISVAPAAFILGATAVERIRRSPKNRLLKAVALPLLLLALASSSSWTVYRVYTGGESTEEGKVMYAVMEMKTIGNYAYDENVAAYIKEHIQGRKVLADADSVDRIVLFTQDPQLFILTADPDFGDRLRSPVGSVEYVLVPDPEITSTFDAILDRYPDIWKGGVPFAQLEKDFGKHRLYRVRG